MSISPDTTTCLVFDADKKSEADAALAAQEGLCATCESCLDGSCDGWGDVQERPDGKWWFFAHPLRMAAVEGVFTYIQEEYSHLMEDVSGE